VVGIIVDDDLVCIPEPAVTIGYFPGEDAEVKTTKPEPRWASAGQAPDMSGPESGREVTVFPRAVEPKARIFWACSVADPDFALVHVRGVGMSRNLVEMLRWRLIVRRVSYRRGSFGRRPAWMIRVLVRSALFRSALLLSRGSRAHGERQEGDREKTTDVFHSHDSTAAHSPDVEGEDSARTPAGEGSTA